METTEHVVQREVLLLLQRACEQKVSDVHFIPTQAMYRIAFRQQGMLEVQQELAVDLLERMVTYLKYLANLDIAEKRKPQSGAFYMLIETKNYHFRISTLPSILNKESVVIRIHQPNAALPLKELAYFPSITQQFEKLLAKTQGILFVTGATGSGKTTTLYSFIHYAAQSLKKHVISLEDPVESIQEHIVQIQINERAGVSYAAGLRAILRHTPDVIMVGEIRDEATAHIAIKAALSGHLVLASIHAKDTVSCIYRLLDFGISLEDIRQTLLGIIAQTLVEMIEDNELLRRALFELLIQQDLQMALECVKLQQPYTLPVNKQLHYQKEAVITLEHTTAETNATKKA